MTKKSEKRGTLVMGILNVTPDSFSDGGKYFGKKKALLHARQLAESGADIIDIGGESSRPGSKQITSKEEIKRVIPVLIAIKRELNIPISVDTYKPEVIKAALSEGADYINDITALSCGKEKSAKLIAKCEASCILMHMKGMPGTMQNSPRYKNVVKEIKEYLKNAADFAVSNGIKKNNIYIDPGLGFGKKLEHNIEILKNITYFKDMGYKILVGASRKSFIGEITGKPIDDRDKVTQATTAFLVMHGVDMIRVHDVSSAIDTIKIVEALM
ncbi:MAG: dihydropteroate synthase [Candidatus Omnitrophica bacterium]|nr:dihydropteroate synthase [Candidatus Omnitrophota bacterium]